MAYIYNRDNKRVNKKITGSAYNNTCVCFTIGRTKII